VNEPLKKDINGFPEKEYLEEKSKSKPNENK
jgi:hypothetical protein